jgi:arylsulfatase A-like enzyme
MIWDYLARSMRGEPERATDVLPQGLTLRDVIAAYYAATTCTDSLFGDILAILDRAEILSNAIIVFASDHGDNLGSHHLMEKGQLYEESIRVPMLIQAPGLDPTVNVDRVAQLIDVLPTVLDLAGLDIPGHVQGRSLVAALHDNGSSREPEGAFIETPTGEIGIRTTTRLVGMALAREDQTTITDEHLCAYDLETDPFQLHNVSHDPSEQSWQYELRSRLIAWHASTPRLVPGPVWLPPLAN